MTDQKVTEKKAQPGTPTVQCMMCDFLFRGYKNAHSKQAKAEYGEGFLNHFTILHPDVFHHSDTA